jgi:hypothetical protein
VAAACGGRDWETGAGEGVGAALGALFEGAGSAQRRGALAPGAPPQHLVL